MTGNERLIEFINRQKAEIENLNVYCENLEISQNHLLNELATARKNAKSEAIKEFAESLNNFILSQLGISTMDKREAYYFCLDKIDNLVKEMTEGDAE